MSGAEIENGDRCVVIAGTHKGKSGVVHDRTTSKTGHVTITETEQAGVDADAGIFPLAHFKVVMRRAGAGLSGPGDHLATPHRQAAGGWIQIDLVAVETFLRRGNEAGDLRGDPVEVGDDLGSTIGEPEVEGKAIAGTGSPRPPDPTVRDRVDWNANPAGGGKVDAAVKVVGAKFAEAAGDRERLEDGWMVVVVGRRGGTGCGDEGSQQNHPGKEGRPAPLVCTPQATPLDPCRLHGALVQLAPIRPATPGLPGENQLENG